MFQSFETLRDPTKAAGRVKALRGRLSEMSLDGFVVPHADAHQSEYLPADSERLFWLTGFSGSAGTAIILGDRAALFVDGRYTIQVRDQADPQVFDFHHLIDGPPAAWLKRNVSTGGRIGFDPWLHTPAQVEKLKTACATAGAELVAVDANPVDAIWTDRPASPSAMVELHPVEYAGEDRQAKIARIAAEITNSGCDAAVLTKPESIAWLLNIRGGDVDHTPLVLANAIVPAEGMPMLFVDGAKLSNAVRAALADAADIREPDAFATALHEIGKDGARIGIDASLTPFAVQSLLETAGATLVRTTDPVSLPRALKNTTEIDGARSAHHRDIVPMCRFLAWIDREARNGEVDEISAARKLEALRTETGALRDISFDTISAFGPNAALPHYRVSEDSNRRLQPGSLYLVDSGAQYSDGTTDITRTIAVGTPSSDMIRHFTLVLKGHIALAMLRFPVGTTGAQIDAIARQALWNAGCDYDHGTGHGVGSFLGVHEGPQRIAKTGTTPLKPGMIVSNEPGYYRDGAYGIRTENLLLVTEPEDLPGGDRPMLSFETLTFTPIDRRLIDASQLSAIEQDWLDRYHADVRDRAGDRLDGADRDWLFAATAPLRDG